MRTITFYSYKGGVGRTLVVANIARYLARLGQKVVAVDFDLEAPGLHYKMGLAGQVDRGLIDYIHTFFLEGEQPGPVNSYLIEVPRERDMQGSIHVMPAGTVPSSQYWRKLSRINWHELFYSEHALGIPFFLELRERIAEEISPDYLLIDSRTGITEIGGVATSLLADQVICLVLNTQENLEGAREVLRSIQRAPRLPGQGSVEIVPVLTRIPELDDVAVEERVLGEVRDFLNEGADDLAATLHFEEVLILHADPELQMREFLRIGEGRPEESVLLRDYLRLFNRLIPRNVIESFLEPLIRQAVEKEAEDPDGAQRDLESLVAYSYNPEVCRELVRLFRARRTQSEASERAGHEDRAELPVSYAISGMTGEQGDQPQLVLSVNLAQIEVPEIWSRAGMPGVRLGDLAESGWGVIFHSEVDPEIREALRDLLDLRRAQAGRSQEDFYREFVGDRGYRPGDTKSSFLARHGVGPGPVRPDRMPYYLLIVGGPEEIPFSFQRELDVRYAVGRIAFSTPAEYAQYARSVVKVELGCVNRQRCLTLFGVRHPDDPATEWTTQHLVQPLSKRLRGRRAESWSIQEILGEEATKVRLRALLGGAETPALLFTASHSLLTMAGSKLQFSHQGSLLCQEWTGPGTWRGPIPAAFYFSGEDIVESADVKGLISFHFGGFTAGTPMFEKEPDGQQRNLAPKPFISRLALRLLGHPRGGALAVVGQIGRGWQTEEELEILEGVFELLMGGYPLGAAMELYNQAYAERAVEFAAFLSSQDSADPDELAQLWQAVEQMRGYIIIGDPAVRLAVQSL